MTTEKDALNELLAVVFRDGGQAVRLRFAGSVIDAARGAMREVRTTHDRLSALVAAAHGDCATGDEIVATVYGGDWGAAVETSAHLIGQTVRASTRGPSARGTGPGPAPE